jgi:hypothetical protein
VGIDLNSVDVTIDTDLEILECVLDFRKMQKIAKGEKRHHFMLQGPLCRSPRIPGLTEGISRIRLLMSRLDLSVAKKLCGKQLRFPKRKSQKSWR